MIAAVPSTYGLLSVCGYTPPVAERSDFDSLKESKAERMAELRREVTRLEHDKDALEESRRKLEVLEKLTEKELAALQDLVGANGFWTGVVTSYFIGVASSLTVAALFSWQS